MCFNGSTNKCAVESVCFELHIYVVNQLLEFCRRQRSKYSDDESCAKQLVQFQHIINLHNKIACHLVYYKNGVKFK